jgi:hypothetical protein
LAGDPASLSTFGNLVLHAGFVDLAAPRYTRRFAQISSSRIVNVSGAFPRITRASVPVEIRSARYEVDLDLVEAQDVGLVEALRQLGVIREWS